MTKLTTLAHKNVLNFINKKDLSNYFLDGTCGNGHDTLFLAHHVGKFGKVWSFDIQKQALATAKKYLTKNGKMSKVHFIHDSHEHTLKYVPNNKQGHICGFMLNLGYLPHSDKTIITQAHSTIKALNSFYSLLKPAGGGTVLIYPGHKGGGEESFAIQNWLMKQKKYYLLLKSEQKKTTDPFLIVLKKNSTT